MNVFNSAEAKAILVGKLVAAEGAPFVTMTPAARDQLGIIVDAMVEKFGCAEADLTEDQKVCLGHMVDISSPFDITRMAVDGVIQAIPQEEVEKVLGQIRDIPEAAAVEITFFTTIVREIVAENDKFVPCPSM